MTTDTELPKSWRQHAAEAIADLPAGHSAVKFISWAVIHIEDCNEHVLSVEKEIVEESDERHRLENVIRGLQAGMHELNKSIVAALHYDPFDASPKDLTAFTNIMAAHGVEPYAKPKRKRKAQSVGASA